MSTKNFFVDVMDHELENSKVTRRQSKTQVTRQQSRTQAAEDNSDEQPLARRCRELYGCRFDDFVRFLKHFDMVPHVDEECSLDLRSISQFLDRLQDIRQDVISKGQIHSSYSGHYRPINIMAGDLRHLTRDLRGRNFIGRWIIKMREVNGRVTDGSTLQTETCSFDTWHYLGTMFTSPYLRQTLMRELHSNGFADALDALSSFRQTISQDDNWISYFMRIDGIETRVSLCLETILVGLQVLANAAAFEDSISARISNVPPHSSFADLASRLVPHAVQALHNFDLTVPGALAPRQQKRVQHQALQCMSTLFRFFGNLSLHPEFDETLMQSNLIQALAAQCDRMISLTAGQMSSPVRRACHELLRLFANLAKRNPSRKIIPRCSETWATMARISGLPSLKLVAAAAWGKILGAGQSGLSISDAHSLRQLVNNSQEELQRAGGPMMILNETVPVIDLWKLALPSE